MSRLKYLRAHADMSSAKVAAAAGVDPGTYAEWECGLTKVPDAKLAILAKLFGTDARTLVDRHPPIEVGIAGLAFDDEIAHYGEVAFHFAGGGEPLLLSISDHTCGLLQDKLDDAIPFLTVRTLGGQTVIVRTDAISDVHFSSVAHNDRGPEGDKDGYPRFTGIVLPDPRDWRIIEASRWGEDEPFAKKDVKRVDAVVDDAARNYDPDKGVSAADRLEWILEAATDTIWQLSTGARRQVTMHDGSDLYDAFSQLVDSDDVSEIDDRIRIQIEGDDHVAYVSKNAFDYIALPSHRFEDSQWGVIADMIDAGATSEALPEPAATAEMEQPAATATPTKGAGRRYATPPKTKPSVH
jgi:transcriptional regulator with XRE-family HTH domain